ncbi:glycosyltransferase family 2 protein [Pseudooceanicola antarcticus]|uniref:Glycosyl transferase family 2 n=2 Tax=Pseudooceanicola antarcticus TaxID=1247613 RepID=A0ABX4MQN6_9RHOB|nr:glycosyltransferase family 2 protein [Pseudooceanicola antarcticus]PJE29802.1 hypothetical protein CVM39_07820 [Pseudooceanicola antarcticus]
MSGSSTYGGYRRVTFQMERRQSPMSFAEGEALPPLDIDLAPLKTARTEAQPGPHDPALSDHANKIRELSQELAGQPQLLALHGLLIAHLRRRAQPAHCAALFLRLWREEADFLLENLDARWLVSAVTTFADHGATEVQRRLGHGLTVLFSTMKLYETERLHSGTEPWQPFPELNRRPRKLALEMDRYSIHGGGLDANMLGRLWEEARQDALIWPLAQHLLVRLDRDDRNVFRRLQQMRRANGRDPVREARSYIRMNDPEPDEMVVSTSRVKKQTDPEQLRWGLVTTARAPLAQIARFAAYHLDLGAAQMDLYLDTPDEDAARYLARDPRLRVVQCDAAYWQGMAEPRPEDHRARQQRNAQASYLASDLHFLGHIDVDEYLMPPLPVAELLAHLPPRCAALQFHAAELLAGSESAFKLTPQDVGHDRRALAAAYPQFGEHLKGGFISHTIGKCLARTGLPGVQVGIHRLRRDGQVVRNTAVVMGGYLGHAHARSFEDFLQRLDFRMTRGSYRKREDDFGLHDVFRIIRAEEGEAGLRRFFDACCADSPGLRARLERYGMLFTHPLELDAKCRRIFGQLPEELPA